MRHLYLIRHAKASWEDPAHTDIDRPLVELGEKDAHDVAQVLKKQKIKPDLIIASPAKRAQKTAEIMATVLGYPIDRIQTDPHFYSGATEEMVELIKKIDSKIKTVFCFGHNPSMTWLVHYFCDEAKMNLPTCGVAGIEFKTTVWAHVSDSDSKLLCFFHPDHALLTKPLLESSGD